MPRVCIVYSGICLTVEEDHGETSGYPKGVGLTSAESDSFSRLGRHLTMASTGLLAPTALGFRVRRRGQPSVSVVICRVAELVGSPHQLTLTQSSQSGLFYDR